MIYENMSFADYRAMDGLNSSTLKGYAKSVLDGVYEESKVWDQSIFKTIGTIAHSAVLEGDEALQKEMDNNFITSGYPYNKDKPFGKTSAKFKNWYAEQNTDKTVLFPDELIVANKIINSIKGHKPASNILKRCSKRELTITWTCKHTGVDCKARIDACDFGIALDLKTTSCDFELGILEKEMHKRMYHMQFSFYADGLHENGIDPDEFYVIFAQTKEPYDVGCFEVNYTALEQGRTDYINAIQNYNKRKEVIKPGRFPNITQINIPYYAIDEEHQGVDLEGM